MEPSNTATAVALLRAVASGDADAAASYMSPNGFVQHDPSGASDVAGPREQASRAMGDEHLEVARVLEDDPFVVAHGRSGIGDVGEVFFAVFLFEDGLVAEQWRFTAPEAPASESGHTQTDGQAEPDGRVDTGRAKKLVRDYYETVHIGGQHDRINDFMSGDRQIRHEPGVIDGVAAFKRDLAVLTRNCTIDEIVLLAGQGDLVFIAARGTKASRAPTSTSTAWRPASSWNTGASRSRSRRGRRREAATTCSDARWS